MRMSIAPKLCSAAMTPTTAAKKIVGDMSGTMTRQNDRHALAPSIRAASSTSSGSDWSPAIMMMNEKPRNCHAWMPATASIAHAGDWAIPGAVLTPSHCMSPLVGLRIVLKMTAATRPT